MHAAQRGGRHVRSEYQLIKMHKREHKAEKSTGRLSSPPPRTPARRRRRPHSQRSTGSAQENCGTHAPVTSAE